jgi:hypothetical protein
LPCSQSPEATQRSGICFTPAQDNTPRVEPIVFDHRFRSHVQGGVIEDLFVSPSCRHLELWLLRVVMPTCATNVAQWKRARAFRDKMTTTSFDIPRELLEKKDKRFFLWCSLKDSCDDKKERLFGQLLR